MKRTIFATLILLLTLLFAVSCGCNEDNGGTDSPNGPTTPPKEEYSFEGLYTLEGADFIYEFSDGNVFTVEECEIVENSFLLKVFGSDFLEIKGDEVCDQSGQVVFVKSGDAYVLSDEFNSGSPYFRGGVKLNITDSVAKLQVLMGTYVLNPDNSITILESAGGSSESLTVHYGENYILAILGAWIRVGCEVDPAVIRNHIRETKDRTVMNQLVGKVYVRKNPSSGFFCNKIEFGTDTLSMFGLISEVDVEYGLFNNNSNLCYDSSGSSFSMVDFRMEGESIFLSDQEFVLADGNSDFSYTVNPDGVSCTLEGVDELGDITVVPEIIDGYTVTAISSYCFSGIETNSIIVIPKTVTNIEYQAFYGYEYFYLFYAGSAEEWENVTRADDFNIYIMTRFYSESAKEGAWYYKDGVPTLY